MKTRCEVHYLGVIDYQQAWQLQSDLADEIGRGLRSPSLLLLEHPHCYTFGRRGKSNNLLWDEAALQQAGVPVYWVDRGGDVTYHGPGQLVGYPLVRLTPPGVKPASSIHDESQPAHIPQADYMGYLRKLEMVIIQAVGYLGVKAFPIPGLTGVWVQPKAGQQPAGQLYAGPQCQHDDSKVHQNPAKLAAMGIKVDARGVTRHGFALNVNPDRRYWAGIIPCGLKDHNIASLSDYIQPTPSMQEVASLVSLTFGDLFDFEMIETRS